MIQAFRHVKQYLLTNEFLQSAYEHVMKRETRTKLGLQIKPIDPKEETSAILSQVITRPKTNWNRTTIPSFDAHRHPPPDPSTR